LQDIKVAFRAENVQFVFQFSEQDAGTTIKRTY
jgi:hypothetical protein